MSVSALTKKASYILAGLLASTALFPAAAAPAQTKIPDFSSNNFGYQANSVFFHPLPGAKYIPILPPAEHPYCGNRDLRKCPKGQLPALGDDTNPILKPWAAEQMRKFKAGVLGGKQSFQAMARCWPGGVPGMMVFTAEPAYMLQTPEEVTIVYSRGPNIRHIYMNQEHTKNPKPSWLGESVGHYEGDSLVIDTIGQTDKTFTDFFHTPHTTKLHVTEKYYMTEYGEVIGANNTLKRVSPMFKGEFMVDDPDAFTTPWGGWNDFTIDHTPISESESICAENNDANYFGEDEIPIPQAKTADF